MCVPSLWHDKHRAAHTVRLRKVRSYLISYTTSARRGVLAHWYLRYITYVSIVTRSRHHLVQVSSANEQHEQQKQQKQQKQKQTGCGETRVSSLSPGPASTISVEVRIPVI